MKVTTEIRKRWGLFGGSHYIFLDIAFTEDEKEALKHPSIKDTPLFGRRYADLLTGLPYRFNPKEQKKHAFITTDNRIYNQLLFVQKNLNEVISGFSPVSAPPTQAPPQHQRTVTKMQVSIERKPHTYTTWFGMGKEKQSGADIVIAAEFSEVEKEIIKRGALRDYVIYEHPIDQEDYARWQAAREKWLREGQGAGGYLGSCKTYPNAQPSLLVGNFLQAPAQTIHPGWKWQDDISMMNAEREIEENFKKLRGLIEAVEQHPTGKRTLDL